jgi:hypothetical protein
MGGGSTGSWTVQQGDKPSKTFFEVILLVAWVAERGELNLAFSRGPTILLRRGEEGLGEVSGPSPAQKTTPGTTGSWSLQWGDKSSKMFFEVVMLGAWVAKRGELNPAFSSGSAILVRWGEEGLGEDSGPSPTQKAAPSSRAKTGASPISPCTSAVRFLARTLMGTEAKVDRLTLHRRTQLSDPGVGQTPDILVLLTMELIRRRQTALWEKLKGSRKNNNANLVGQASRLLI